MESKKGASSAHILYTRMDSNNPISPHTLIRNDIQSLRSLAIIFVLLFHMWPSKFKFGFLGVDMFFVISGYLIFMLLSRKRPIDASKTWDFYFRRVKRIVPIYLFIVATTLFAILHLLSPIEFTQVVDESIPALAFYSNMPSSRPFKYFDISSKLYFFLHTWSLSVEMQFYLAVPTLFFALDSLDKIRPTFKWLLIGTIPLASFSFQTLSTGDSSHMLLTARLWQFFAGFAAHYAYESRVFNFSKDEEEDKTSKKQTADNCVSLILCSLLCSFFMFGFNFHTQLNRFVVILLTALLVGRYSETSAFLTNRFVVIIGDASYSIYLVHWPLFTWHRYANMAMYSNNQEADLTTGALLILTSMIAGYLIEKSFKFVLRQLDTWTFLLAFLLFGYYVSGVLVYQLRSKEINLNEVSLDKQTPEWETKLRQDTIMLWDERHRLSNYTHDEVTAFNSEFIHAYQTLAFCDDKNPQLPTHFPINMSSYDHGTSYVCHAMGNGTKNIVLIGNSHAMHSFPGIWHIFRNTYKRLTLFARNSCIPASLKFQQPGRSEKVKKECVRLLNETVLALQEWREPIDVIIAFYALVDMPDYPLPVDMKTDELLNSMQEFYSSLGRIPKDALILYENFPLFSENAISEVSSRMKSGKPLDTIGDQKKTLVDRLSTLRTRSEYLHCEKCIKLKLIDNWCAPGNNSFCHSAERHGLIYFADWHHPSAYGAFFNAQYMKRLYEQFIG